MRRAGTAGSSSPLSVGPSMSDLVAALRDGLAALADPAAAITMRAYMRDVEPFCGVPKPARERLLRDALAVHPVRDAAALRDGATRLWSGATCREERYLAVSLVGHRRHAGWPDRSWLPLYREWIVEGAWWDTTDEMANRHVGRLLRTEHDEVAPTLRAWATDPDRWLRRTAVIAQLGAKDAIDLHLLTAAIEANLRDQDFFLRKGIGWALRQHARTDSEWVRTFVATHPALSPLSRREALKHLS